MTTNSNYKLHLPVVKVSTSERVTSVTSHKVLISREKYYQNKVENDLEHEYPNNLNTFFGDTKF